MKVIENLQHKVSAFSLALRRYPLVVLFLLCATVVNADMIHHSAGNHLEYLFTFLIGALMGAVAQHIYERFFTETYVRFLLMGFAVALTAGYYIVARLSSDFNMELDTKTAVAVFALLMAFVWVPSIKNRLTFNQFFLAAFKAFFTVLLFSVVLAVGVNAIWFAVDLLLYSLDYQVNLHVLNVIFTLFAPLFFLSFIPQYPGKSGEVTEEQARKMEKAMMCPRTLDVLISYIIIPLAAIETIVLLIYILINIRADFWTDNLLEPMLVSYAITVILVYILASNLENQVVTLFKKVFPKVLIPIVLFQTLASVLKIGDAGVTYGRYYVILFGVFAVICAVIFSVVSTRKNGWISAVLIVAAAVSIIPPVDAFTLSRASQVHLLQATLHDNGMIEDGEIVAKSDIPVKDKQKITSAVEYLAEMHDTEQIDWLPSNVSYGDNFRETFGFAETHENSNQTPGNVQYATLDTASNPTIDIAGYDQMIRLFIDYGEKPTVPVKINGTKYQLKQETDDQSVYLTLTDDHDRKLLTFNAKKAFNRILKKGASEDLGVDEATVTSENNAARMGIVADSIHYDDGEYHADLYVLLEIK